MKYFFRVLLFFLVFQNSICAQYPDWESYSRNDEVQCLANEGNYIWIGTYTGLVKLDKTTGSHTVYTKQNSGISCINVTALLIDSFGNKWIGTASGGLSKFDGINWTNYNTHNSPISCDWITDLALDKNNNLWIGEHCGLDRLSGSTWMRFDQSTMGIQLPGGVNVESIICDTNSVVYVGFSMSGLGRYDGNWRLFNRANSTIQNDEFWDMVLDSKNNIWAGSPSGNSGTCGLTKIRDSTFSCIIPAFVFGTIANLSIDKHDTIWFTSQYSFGKFYGNSYTIIDTSYNSQIGPLHHACELLNDNGTIWFNPYPFNGLKKLDRNYNITAYPLSASAITLSFVTDFCVDQQQNAWLTFGGPWELGFHGTDRFDQHTFVNYNHWNHAIPVYSMINVAVDPQNNIWWGSEYEGLVN